MSLSEIEIERYSRQIRLNNFGLQAQLKLKNASVLVVGAGGLGCPALLYLAAAGVGKIGIADGDLITLSNLHRQVLYHVKDINKNKSVVAKKKLLAINPAIKVKSYTAFISIENALKICKNFDVIIDASDNFKTKYLLNDVSIILNKPLVYAALQEYEAHITVFNYRNGPTLRCLFANEATDSLIDNCANTGVLGVLPGIAGTWQAQEVIKIIAQIGEVLSGKLLIFNCLNNEVNTLSFNAIEKNKQLKHLSTDGQKNNLLKNEIDTQTLHKWILLKNITIIDVREPYEFEEYNIGGINIPLSLLPQKASLINKENKIIFICQFGRKSAMAFKLFSTQFPEVKIYQLIGGLNAYVL
jgi:adenylyltransferase/sulfurtransferase